MWVLYCYYHSSISFKNLICVVYGLLSDVIIQEMEVDLEVRGAINVVEACARTESIDKIIFSSSLTAAIWRDNIGTQKDVDEKSWSDLDFCLKKKVLFNLFKYIFHFSSFCFVNVFFILTHLVNNL